MNTSWTIRAWPPLLWQAEGAAHLRFNHLETQVFPTSDEEAPVSGQTVWRSFEEYDTADPPDGLPDDYFATIVEAFLATGKGKRGTIGAAPSVLVEANEIVPFAVEWIERALRSAS